LLRPIPNAHPASCSGLREIVSSSKPQPSAREDLVSPTTAPAWCAFDRVGMAHLARLICFPMARSLMSRATRWRTLLRIITFQHAWSLRCLPPVPFEPLTPRPLPSPPPRRLHLVVADDISNTPSPLHRGLHLRDRPAPESP